MYGHKWVSSYGPTDEDDTWRLVLCGVTPEMLPKGLRACADGKHEWPPSAPEFRRMCVGGPRYLDPCEMASRMPITQAMIESDEVKEKRKATAAEYRAKWIEMGLMRK